MKQEIPYKPHPRDVNKPSYCLYCKAWVEIKDIKLVERSGFRGIRTYKQGTCKECGRKVSGIITGTYHNLNYNKKQVRLYEMGRLEK